jgi:voltage-gated potassium channel
LDTFYGSFITATTVGYGDLRPVESASKIASVLIAFLGLMLLGIVVAVTIHAVNLALDTRR